MPKLQANQIFASSGLLFSSQIFCEHKNVIECLYFIYEWNTNMRRRKKTHVYNSFMLPFSGIVISSHEWVASSKDASATCLSETKMAVQTMKIMELNEEN